jgi:hypothetical protein
MDTSPDFSHMVEGIKNKEERKHALAILKHVWGLLDKQDKKHLMALFRLIPLKDQYSKEAKHELEMCKHILHTHPEFIEMFNRFYTKLITPVSSKDHFKHDRITAAAGLEKVVKELQHKNLIKIFDIKRVA